MTVIARNISPQEVEEIESGFVVGTPQKMPTTTATISKTKPKVTSLSTSLGKPKPKHLVNTQQVEFPVSDPLKNTGSRSIVEHDQATNFDKVTPGEKDNKTGAIIAIVLVLVIATIAFILWRRKKKKNGK